MSTSIDTGPSRVPWNKGRLTGQKPPLKLKEIWAIRVRLQLSSQVRDLAMFNLAIDSRLRASFGRVILRSYECAIFAMGST